MNQLSRQGQLFQSNAHAINDHSSNKELFLSSDVIRSWQRKIHLHQSKFFLGNSVDHQQGSLFKNSLSPIENFLPLELTPLPINFWRWPKSPHQGAAIYVIMDRPIEIGSHILLYIGETIAADRRWKGVHDCKRYLNSYCEALSKADLTNQLSIRFWTDVPEDTRSRRSLEQGLIQRWWPPFNKETQSRWTTPFTSIANSIV